MAYCTKCGKPNPEVSKFCTSCGTHLTRSAKTVESEIHQSPIANSQPPIHQKSFGESVETLKIIALKYRKMLLVIFGLVIIFIPVYYLFLKANPSKDAKIIASTLCNCGKDSTKNNIDVLKEYLNGFENRHFKSKFEARTSFNSVIIINQSKYDSCSIAASRKYNDSYLKYSKKGGKDFLTFQQTYISSYNKCNTPEANELLNLYQNIEQKIVKIIDPLPDIEKIKGDLIGNQIPGWSFTYLSEFKKCEIVNETKGIDRTEYLVNLKLLGKDDPNPHDAQVNLVYLQNSDGWYLSEVKGIFITYTNPAPLNGWQQVVPLQNCTYYISNDKKFWVKEGNYDQTYKGGPDGEQFNLTSSYIYIQSRETEPVNLTFTYRPKE